MTPQKTLDLVVRFNCQAHGFALITVRIQFRDKAYEDATFMFMKEHSAPAPSTGLGTQWMALCGCLCVIAVRRRRVYLPCWASRRRR